MRIICFSENYGDDDVENAENAKSAKNAKMLNMQKMPKKEAKTAETDQIAQKGKNLQNCIFVKFLAISRWRKEIPKIRWCQYDLIF